MTGSSKSAADVSVSILTSTDPSKLLHRSVYVFCLDLTRHLSRLSNYTIRIRTGVPGDPAGALNTDSQRNYVSSRYPEGVHPEWKYRDINVDDVDRPWHCELVPHGVLTIQKRPSQKGELQDGSQQGRSALIADEQTAGRPPPNIPDDRLSLTLLGPRPQDVVQMTVRYDETFINIARRCLRVHHNMPVSQ